MNKFLLLTVLCCALAGSLALAADKDKAPQTPATQPATPINKFCAVDRENPVDPTVPTFIYQGKVIGFCCEDCLPKFKKDPEKYMKDLK